MSSDDFGTVNLRRGDRAREIEVIRAHYRRHREALVEMVGDAPTEHLATEYTILIQEIDRALSKLDELEGMGVPAAPAAAPAAATAAAATPSTHPALRGTEPGMRPLVTTPEPQATVPPAPEADSRSRMVLILVAAFVVLGLIGWLIWRASSERRGSPAIVEEQPGVTSTSAEAPVTPAPATTSSATAASTIAISPASHDYGAIRKGTRAVRQFEIANHSEEPVTIQIERSKCRCLYYEHAEVIPPNGRETITVTIDGARAKAGALHETIKVASKKDPTAVATFDVTATIK